jgi:hypothetical protein
MRSGIDKKYFRDLISLYLSNFKEINYCMRSSYEYFICSFIENEGKSPSRITLSFENIAGQKKS